MKQREEGGWVVVGGGQDVEEVQVNTPTSGSAEGTHTPARSEKLNVDRVTSSDASSLTSASTSSLPSLNIEVTSDPPYDPIDIGDEGTYDEAGQRDRADGKVDEVFKLHSSRRMKPTSSGRGVSIPSRKPIYIATPDANAKERRWCRYVNLLFSHRAPPAYVHLERPTRVKLVSITMVLQRPTGWQKPLAKLVVGRDAGQGNAWASVARYNDDYVDELRRRGGGGEGVSGEITWGGVGGKGEYDAHKMFRSCGKMVAGPGDDELSQSVSEVCVSSASGSRSLRHQDGLVTHQLVPKSSPLILDRCREVRLKFHLASLPLGWAWFIPAFHLPEPLPSTEGGSRTHTLHFDRTQIDFALGPGASLRKVLVRLEEVPVDEVSEPARLLSDQEEKAEGVEDQSGEKVKEDGE